MLNIREIPLVDLGNSAVMAFMRQNIKAGEGGALVITIQI